MRIRIIPQTSLLVSVDAGSFTVGECRKSENGMERFSVGAVSEDLCHFQDQPDAHDLSEGFSSQAAFKRAWAEGFEVLDAGIVAKAIIDKMLADGKADEIRVNQAR